MGEQVTGPGEGQPNLELPSFLRRRKAPKPDSAQPTPPEAPEAPDYDDTEPTIELSAEDLAARRDAVAAALATDRDQRAERVTKPRRAAKPQKSPKPPKPPKQRKPLILPAVAASFASAGTGAICGAATLLAGALFIHGCQAIRGVQSCGGGIGVGALVVILGGNVLLGTGLLAVLKVADAVAISFVATALMAAAVVVFFSGYLSALWMVVALPVLTGAMYLGAWRFWSSLHDA